MHYRVLDIDFTRLRWYWWFLITVILFFPLFFSLSILIFFFPLSSKFRTQCSLICVVCN